MLPADKCSRRMSVRCSARLPLFDAGEVWDADAWSAAGSRMTAAASAAYLEDRLNDEGEVKKECRGEETGSARIHSPVKYAPAVTAV